MSYDPPCGPGGQVSSVCIIVENEPAPSDRRVWLEARALLAAGYQVSIICPKGKDCESDFESLEGVEIYRHRIWSATGPLGYVVEYGLALIVEFYLACKIYARHRFSVIQACNPPDTIFFIAIFFKLFGVRFVFDHHDLSPELYETKFGKRGFIYKVLTFLERSTFQTANLCIATNESYREIAITRGGVRPEQTVVVQTCAGLSEVKDAQRNDALKRGERYMVLYVGIMESQDGVNLLIQAIGHLVNQKRRGNTHFVLIGSGSELPNLKASSVILGLEEFVEFTGLIPHSQVGPYLATADVCVAPDPSNPLNDKSTMIKILEYLAFGKPIVMFDLPEGRRTAEEAALYARSDDPVELAGKIEELLDSETLRDKLGQSGRKRTQDGLNWEAQSAKLIAAYDSLFSN